jgi:hypothetical protein
MNLMPDSTLRWRAFNEKKPYFIATIFLLALVAGAIGFLFQKLAAAKENESNDLEPQVQTIQDKANKMTTAYKQLQTRLGEVNQITAWMEARYYWGDVLADLRQVLIRSEDELVKKYAQQYVSQHPAQRQGMQAGIWIEQMTMGTAANAYPGYANSYAANAGANNGTQTATGGALDQTNAITLVFRAVDLSPVDTGANNEIVYAVQRELKTAPLFNPNTVQPSAQISPVDLNGTFTFIITVTPQNVLKLQL